MIPAFSLVVGTVLGSSVPSFKPCVVVSTDSQTGVTIYAAVPMNTRAAVGEAVLHSLKMLPLLQCGVAVFAIFGPFRDVRHKLGRGVMALAAFLSLPVTVVCCLLAWWSINYTNL